MVAGDEVVAGVAGDPEKDTAGDADADIAIGTCASPLWIGLAVDWCRSLLVDRNCRRSSTASCRLARPNQRTDDDDQDDHNDHDADCERKPRGNYSLRRKRKVCFRRTAPLRASVCVFLTIDFVVCVGSDEAVDSVLEIGTVIPRSVTLSPCLSSFFRCVLVV